MLLTETEKLALMMMASMRQDVRTKEIAFSTELERRLGLSSGDLATKYVIDMSVGEVKEKQ